MSVLPVVGSAASRAESAPPVAYTVEAGVATLTLDRPHVLNAHDTALAATLADQAARAAADPDVFMVVVRGRGRAFCSGMDRDALARGEIGEPFYRHWIRALNLLEDMPKLSLAVLHGHAIGGGLQLALACDLRLTTSDAVLALGATRHGLVPDGAVLRLARVVGLGRAKALALLNEEIAPADARAIGLVNWVCPPEGLEAAVADVVARARRASPTATAHTKRWLNASFHVDPRAAIEPVLAAQAACMVSWELGEANRAWQAGGEADFQSGRPAPATPAPQPEPGGLRR